MKNLIAFAQCRLSFLRSSIGNAIVEMLLFTPIALFFLFVVIDAGMLALEKAAISDALRSGMNSELLFGQQGSVIQMGDDFSLQLASGFSLEQATTEVPQLLAEVSSQIVSEVARTQGYEETEVPSSFQVTLAALLLSIDPVSGQVLNSRVLYPIVKVPDGPSSFNLTQYNSDYPHRSMDEFIVEQLHLTADNQPSPYALPAGLAYNPSSLLPGEARYLENAVMLYGEVTAIPRGINNSYVKSALGSFYVLQDQYLIPLRSPFS